MVTPLLLLGVFFYGVTGFYATYPQFIWAVSTNPVMESIRGGILIVTPNVQPVTVYAARFLSSLQVAGWAARIYILVLLLRPVILRHRLEAPREAIEGIFRDHGNDSVAAFAIQHDKHHLLLAGGQALIAYATKGSIALACGDPIAPNEAFARAIEEYVEHCGRHGWTPCVYMASEDRLPVYHSAKLLSLHIAEEAVIDLAALSPTNIPEVRKYDRGRGIDPMIDEQLEEVSEDWLEKRHMREVGFTTGRFSLESIAAGPVFILGSRNRVEAFCAWLPYKNNRGIVLDLVRQRRTAPEAAVHALLLGTLSMLRKEYEEATLPAGTLDRAEVESLGPRWHNRYLVHPRGADISRITRALRAISIR